MRVLFCDNVFPNIYAKWRIEEIKSFIERYDTDILVLIKITDFHGLVYDFNWEELFESHHLYKYDILIFDPRWKKLQKYNDPDFDGNKYHGAIAGTYMLRLKKYRSQGIDINFNKQYDLVYDLFDNSDFRKFFPAVSSDKQAIHFYPGGHQINEEGLKQIMDKTPDETKLIVTQGNMLEIIKKNFPSKNFIGVYGATYLQPDTPKTRKNLNEGTFQITFSSMGNSITKGIIIYNNIAKKYKEKYPEDDIVFNTVGRCHMDFKSNEINFIPIMSQADLDQFYLLFTDVYLNLHSKNFEGFPLGTEAMLQGCVLITTDIYNNNQLNSFNFTDDDGIFIRNNNDEIDTYINILKKLYDDRQLCLDLGMKAQDKTFDIFSYNNQQAKIFNYLKGKLEQDENIENIKDKNNKVNNLNILNNFNKVANMSQQILQHPTYSRSYELFQEIAKNTKTFHYHPHILYVLRELLGPEKKTYMEIGSYYGASSSLILSSEKPTDILALDLFVLEPNNNQEKEFMNNTFHYYKPIHKITPLKGDSQKEETIKKVKKMLNGREIDLFFIDGDHRYRPAVHDFLNYHDLVSKGGYIVFDDYQDHIYSPEVKQAVHWIVKLFKPWYHIIGSLPNQIGAYGGKHGNEIMKKYYNNFILQKKEEEVHINFGIIMATYYRKDGSTLQKIKKAIESIQQQSYVHWTLILVGDKYENTDEFEEIVKLVDEDKIIFRNLEHALERELHQTGKIDIRQLWNNAGANAMSTGLDMTVEAGFSHVVHLDDDDFWEPNHLEELNKTYLTYPETIFAYTCGRFLNTTIPQHKENIKWTYGNLPPRGRNLLHSAVSWRIDIMDLQYPKINFESDDLKTVLNTPADALMWERINQYLFKHQYAYVFIPKVTVNHLEEGAGYF
jgi:predicted O-methyltransferase YrrM